MRYTCSVLEASVMSCSPVKIFVLYYNIVGPWMYTDVGGGLYKVQVIFILSQIRFPVAAVRPGYVFFFLIPSWSKQKVAV